MRQQAIEICQNDELLFLRSLHNEHDVLLSFFPPISRPGRPPKRSPVAGMVSPVPTSLTSATPAQTSVVPYLGFPPTKKPRFTDDPDFGSPSKTRNLFLINRPDFVTATGPDLKHQGHNGNGGTAATAAAMLAANGYSAAFPFLQHFANSSAATSQQQQQQLAAAAAALGLPGLPSSRLVARFNPSVGGRRRSLVGVEDDGGGRRRKRW